MKKEKEGKKRGKERGRSVGKQKTKFRYNYEFLSSPQIILLGRHLKRF
jgi:predicted transposase YdaD